MAASNDLVQTIINATQSNPALTQAMLLGSWMESGWNLTSVGDNGTSFGPFQIHLPAHPGVTKQQAEDPAFAVSYMLPAYQKALTANSDPMMAAALTAFHAERPKNMYNLTTQIIPGWKAVTGVMAADSPGAGVGGPVNSSASSSSGIFGDLLGPISSLATSMQGITEFFLNWTSLFPLFSKFITKIFLPSTWARIMAFSVGVFLIFVGLFLFFTKPRTAINTVEGVGRTVASMVP